eukprot:4007-Heterococcus_DN1.PRE.2
MSDKKLLVRDQRCVHSQAAAWRMNTVITKAEITRLAHKGTTTLCSSFDHAALHYEVIKLTLSCSRQENEVAIMCREVLWKTAFEWHKTCWHDAHVSSASDCFRDSLQMQHSMRILLAPTCSNVF